MSRHLVFACWMHVVAGIFVVGCVALIWVAAAQLAPTFAGTFVPGLVALFGKPIAIVLIALASIEWLSAVALLFRNRTWARFALGAISVLLLFVFPIGTTLAVYTFFALSQAVFTANASTDLVSIPVARSP